jgi:hypothetical protein
MLKRTGSIALSAIALTIAAAAAPATAATKVVSDPQGDASPRFDITSVLFNNGAKRLSATAHVDNLRYGGEQYFSFTFSPRNSPDVFFTAFSKLHADNSLTNRLTLFNDVGEVSRVPCNVASIWSPEADRVKVSIPRSCVDGLSGPQWMTANLGPTPRRAQQDHVLGRFVNERPSATR